MRKRYIAVISCIILFLMSGCGNGARGSEPAAPKADTSPVTIKFSTSSGIFSETEFKQYVQDPVSKKYPYITVQYINSSQKGMALGDLVAAGEIPDIAAGYGSTLKSLKEMQLFYNMDPLIKQNQLDLKQIIPEMLDYIKVNGASDFYGGLPVYNNAFGLFYNKSLFDKFGVPYPKDGMTWEQVGELGKKMTRFDGGTQYRGFFPDSVNRMINQITLYQLDKNNKSTLTTDPWKKAFELWENIYDYPGNSDPPYNTINFKNNQTAFIQGELAMLAGYSNTLFALRSAPDVDWDVVTYPQHPDAMGYSTNVDTPNLSITAQSEHKDAAFRVIETVLTDEVQLDLAKNARMSVLNNDKVKQAFGSGIPEFAGKKLNLSSMTKLKPSVPRVSKYQGSDTNKIVIDAYESVIKHEKDINTALRDANEQLNKLVEQKMAQ